MKNFRIIPVIDVRKGLAVHAKAGKRETYQPVKSWLASKPDPVMLAEAFKRIYGFEELYLADLDAIEGSAGVNLNLLNQISTLTGLKVMVDGGFKSLGEAGEAFGYLSLITSGGGNWPKSLRELQPQLRAKGTYCCYLKRRNANSVISLARS